MKKGEIVIVDSDAILSIVNSSDSNHARAMNMLEMIVREQITLLFPVTMIAEVLTTAKYRLGSPDLIGRIQKIVSVHKENIYIIDEDVLAIANTVFDPLSSKKHSFFDAIVAACAIKKETQVIFSFDHWYETQELVLLTSL